MLKRIFIFSYQDINAIYRVQLNVFIFSTLALIWRYQKRARNYRLLTPDDTTLVSSHICFKILYYLFVTPFVYGNFQVIHVPLFLSVFSFTNNCSRLNVLLYDTYRK